MHVRFEWNPLKAASNLRKHGVSFDTALRAFADPFAFSEQDLDHRAEERWRTLGVVEGHFLLLVVHTIREIDANDQSLEIIRIISAREADPYERKRYEQETR